MQTSIFPALTLALMKPYVVFSSGLFSTMPTFFYSMLKNNLAQNLTLIESKSLLTKQSFELLCDQFEMDKLPLIAHSSTDAAILSSHRLERAVLVDPATIPALSISGLVRSQVKCRVPVKVITSNAYSEFVIPSFQPCIDNAEYIQHYESGHGDILDPFWATVSSMIGIPSSAHTRENFRQFVNDECIKFILDI